jgi:hypothetical protein
LPRGTEESNEEVSFQIAPSKFEYRLNIERNLQDAVTGVLKVLFWNDRSIEWFVGNGYQHLLNPMSYLQNYMVP